MIQIPMLFPGQGSQAVGMTSDLMSQSGPAADFLGTINQVLDLDLLKIMHDGPGEVLTETRNAQPAILAHSAAVCLALREKGIVPSVVAGHSIGEFSAAVAAGVMSAEDGLKVVRRRGELMFSAGQEVPGTMAAVMGMNGSDVTRVCAEVSENSGVVVLANHNSANQVVISGEIEAVAAAGEALKLAGARRVITLNVSGAFHSPLLSQAGAEFSEFLQGIDISNSQVPLVANVSATKVDSAIDLLDGFGRQLTAPVRWHETMELLAGEATDRPAVVLEVGPGKVLSNMARRAYPEVKFIPVGTLSELDGIEDLLATTE
ncbi:MAG: ACP S-malonyltransferase [bacterium]|nr:ACP S-malonyltransferase [bacterium]